MLTNLVAFFHWGLVLFLIWFIITLPAFLYRLRLKSLRSKFPYKSCLEYVDNCNNCKALLSNSQTFWSKEDAWKDCSAQHTIIREKIKKLETYQPIFNILTAFSAIFLIIGLIYLHIVNVYIIGKSSATIILQRGNIGFIIPSLICLLLYFIICFLIIAMFLAKMSATCFENDSKFIGYFEKVTVYSLYVVFIICLFLQFIMAGMYLATKDNIVETTQYGVRVEAEQRSLTYFCNIPLQNVSGSISGSSGLFGGSISGEISTLSELPYWYLYNELEAKYDVAPASTSKMVPLQEGEAPYLEIVKYEDQTTFDNQNSWGKVWTQTTNTWTQYEFHLPAQIVQGFSMN